nr:fibrillin-1-like [Nomia melanderi]
MINNMRRTVIVCASLLTLLAVDTLAIEGVKGGHRSHTGAKGGRPGQNVAVNTTVSAGLCYKTIPYADALAMNSTGQFPHNTLPSTHEAGTTNGLITILDCCDGYERNLMSGGCEPRCNQGCYGGKCTAPNVCSCPPGWFPQEGVCMPYCEMPCQKDAYCFSPNVCACKLGYDEVNGECKPICPGGCNNGDCVAPRVCRCKPGYSLQSSADPASVIEPKICVPVCENCRNGECTAPGVCTCHEGYKNPPGDTETCNPVCLNLCEGGDCVSPGVCKCKPGFTLGPDGRCVPDCPTGCPNGECVAPGVCTCKPGYSIDPTGKCAPQCLRGCTNGVCVAPNTCNCSPGYTQDPSGNCIPECPQGCPNGECVSPGVCNCKIGFTRDSTGSCVPLPGMSSTGPLCKYGCGANGTCVGPNRCVCDLGSRVDPDTGMCIPSLTSFQCRNGCGSHGVCVGPDLCICDYGLMVDPETGKCPEPRPTDRTPSMCRYGCGPYGRCVGPNQCICEAGYVMDLQTGRCTQPTRDPSQAGEPICETPCLNGDCVGLNQCNCKRGYTMDLADPTRSRCLPVCIGGCPNGVCTAPNFCICNIGYRKETGVKGRQRCVPHPVSSFWMRLPEAQAAIRDGETLSSSQRRVSFASIVRSNSCEMKLLVFVIILFSIVSPQSGCKSYKTARRTKYQSYLETYRAKTWGIFYTTKMRVNYKVVSYLDHFWDCCYGYENVYGLCRPICEIDCESRNATCTYPNTCTCNDGFQRDDLHSEFYCRPICNNGCLFGTCVAPNTCECNMGYQLIENTCEPVCSEPCHMGKCIAPETCLCEYGYKLLEGSAHICEPVCENTCVNGNCTAPETCTCYTGYMSGPLLYGSFVCVPVCDGGCSFGVCIEPNVCECDPGYQLIENTCRPVCSKPCEMGTCIAPEICTCYYGYGLTERSAYICEPVCEKACVNGTCTAPGICDCHEGFVLSDDESEQHVCKPHCDPPCGPYGECTAPNTCTCLEGYYAESMDHSVNTSISTVERFVVCQPECEEWCKQHGHCSSPRVCTCDPGYQFHQHLMMCLPVCDEECVNGYCDTPNKCGCLSNYEPLMGKPNVCVPVCYDGYVLDGMTCTPVCTEPCGEYGLCVAPGACRCNDGYRYVNNTTEFTCEPVCDLDCQNGTCEAPNVCTCHSGFAKDEDGRCQPTCASCENGTCVAPEVCQCDEGYALVAQGNRSFCEITCGNCTNGKCVAVGECECDVGFVKNGNDTGCVSACGNNCNDRGLCVTENGTCECYYGWNGPLCEQPAFCILVVENGTEYLNATSVADNVNDTIVSTFSSSPICFNDCLDEIGNETLCFDKYRPVGEENDFVACLMNTDSTCYTIAAGKESKIANSYTFILIAGNLVIMILAIIALLVAIRKYRTRSFAISAAQTSALNSCASLLPAEDSTL